MGSTRCNLQFEGKCDVSWDRRVFRLTYIFMDLLVIFCSKDEGLERYRLYAANRVQTSFIELTSIHRKLDHEQTYMRRLVPVSTIITRSHDGSQSLL